MDHQVGRLLQVVEAMEGQLQHQTVILFFGDHGWQLGEHGEWAKYSTCETATRTPLIIRYPGASTTSRPKQLPTMSSDIVELVDVMPTLIDLAMAGRQLPSCPRVISNSSVGAPLLCTEGRSLRADMMRAQQGTSGSSAGRAFSQYARPGDKPVWPTSTDMADCNNITVMGYTLRTPAWRYTEWVSYRCRVCPDGAIESEEDWRDVHAKELYAVQASCKAGAATYTCEDENLAQDPAYALVSAQLSKELRVGWQGDVASSHRC